LVPFCIRRCLSGRFSPPPPPVVNGVIIPDGKKVAFYRRRTINRAGTPKRDSLLQTGIGITASAIWARDLYFTPRMAPTLTRALVKLQTGYTRENIRVFSPFHRLAVKSFELPSWPGPAPAISATHSTPCRIRFTRASQFSALIKFTGQRSGATAHSPSQTWRNEF